MATPGATQASRCWNFIDVMRAWQGRERLLYAPTALTLRPCFVQRLLNSPLISLMLCLVFGLSPVAYFKGGGSHVNFSRLNESTCHKIGRSENVMDT